MTHGNTDEGLLDDAFGSLDESIHRQFDPEGGGGFADETAAFVWGFGDWAGGDVDETVGQAMQLQKYILAAVVVGGAYYVGTRYTQ